MISSARWPFLALLPLVALAWAIYYPGLSSVFLLDDYQNLKTLERVESPATLQSLASAALSNPSGDSGRSLAMLSFAAQHESWPDNPRAFKRANLFIHCANAVLLFVLALQVGVLRKLSTTQSATVALLVSATWVLQPMHVSTVLYVVQRMTLLACTFILIGLIGYLLGRRYVLHRPWPGYAIMTCSLAVGGGLALLCKEIAILLPLHALVFETTILRNLPRPHFYRQWLCMVVWLPIGIVLSYFAFKYSNWILPGYDFRSFTPVERLLTESRAVVEYLGLLLLPRAGEFGLFHDDYAASHDLVTPPTTLFSIVVLLSLLVTAVIRRKRYPAYSLAVLMFLGGHLLESTIIPLELYFEHRNYVPSLGLAIGMGFGLQHLCVHLSVQAHRKALISVAAIWLVLLAATTWNETRLWGDPFLQARVWAAQHPKSERAQLQLATANIISGNYDKAISLYSMLSAAQPASYILWASLNCTSHGSAPVPYAEATLALQNASFSKLEFGALEQIVLSKEDKTCSEFSTDKIIGFIDALMENPNFQTRKVLWLILKGRLLVSEGDTYGGLTCFDAALLLSQDVELALLSAKVSAQAGDFHRTKQYLQRAHESNTLNGLSRFTYDLDIKDWEKWLERAQMNQSGTGIQRSK